MVILWVILWILLWILIVAGALIGLVLLIVLILLLGRIKYKINAHIGGDTSVYVNVSYLMRLVRFVVTYKDGEYKNKGRIAWIRIGEDKPKKDEKAADKEPKKPAAMLLNDYTESNTRSTTRNYTTAPVKEEEKTPHPESSVVTDMHKETPSQEKEVTQKPSDPPAADPSPDDNPSTSNSPTSILAHLRALLTYPDLKIIIGLCLRGIQKLLHALKPKHLDIYGVVGFDDPAVTGWFMGAYEAAAGTMGLRHKIRLAGSYHEKALRLDIDAKGRIRLIRLIWPLIWLYMKKPIRTLINKLRKGDLNE